jgi:hypothetical protein
MTVTLLKMKDYQLFAVYYRGNILQVVTSVAVFKDFDKVLRVENKLCNRPRLGYHRYVNILL